MAVAVKKAKVTPVVKTVIKKPISKEPVYTVNYDSGDDECHGSVRTGNSEFEFEIRTQGTPYCCGLSELGTFTIESNSNNVPRAAKVELIRRMLERMVQQETEGSECITMVFTTINNETCRLVDDAVSDGALFTLVKTFTNINSSAVNRLYVSNN